MKRMIKPVAGTKMSKEAKKERRAALFQYGLEIRYMPMFRSIQASSKYVSTDVWLKARDELLFSKVFDRMIELRGQANWAPLQMRAQELEGTDLSFWDVHLKEMKWMAVDFAEERKWKRIIAKQLAEEAMEYVRLNRKTRLNGLHLAVDERTVLSSIHQHALSVIGFPSDTVEVVQHKRKLENDTQEPAFLNPSGFFVEDAKTEFQGESWSGAEDQFLIEKANELYYCWKLVAFAINTEFGQPLRSEEACKARYTSMKGTPVAPNDLAAKAKRHLERFTLMRGEATKIVAPKTLINKKLTLNAHPSHDAAARKANLSISKILTPSEIAMRRMQRQVAMPPPPQTGAAPAVPGNPAATPSAATVPGGSTPVMQTASLTGSPAKARQQSAGMAPGQTVLGAMRKPSAFPPSTAPVGAPVGAVGVRPPMATPGQMPAQRFPMTPQAQAVLQQQQQLAMQRAALLNRQQAMGLYIQQQQQQGQSGPNGQPGQPQAQSGAPPANNNPK